MSEFLTRESAAEAARVRVEIPSDQGDVRPFVIRRLTTDHMIEAGLIPRDLSLFVQESIERAKRSGDAEGEARVAQERVRTEAETQNLEEVGDRILLRGLVKPSIWTGPEELCPNDHVLLADLNPWRPKLVDAIWQNSLTGEAVAKAMRFRDPAEVGRPAVQAGGDGGVPPVGPAGQPAPPGTGAEL